MEGIKRQLLLIALISLTGCAGTGAFKQACRYPKIDQVIGTKFRQYQRRDCIEYAYDLDFDGNADVYLLYLCGKATGNYTTRSRFPYIFIWVDNDGKPYAQQFDLDVNGSIDAVSGDAIHLNRMLDREEKK